MPFFISYLVADGSMLLWGIMCYFAFEVRTNSFLTGATRASLDMKTLSLPNQICKVFLFAG